MMMFAGVAEFSESEPESEPESEASTIDFLLLMEMMMMFSYESGPTGMLR